MFLRRIVVAVVGLAVAAGCSIPSYYTESNLNNLAVGQTKESLLRSIPSGDDIQGLTMRAARRTASGKLLEVGEVPLKSQRTDWSGKGKDIIVYWLLFEDGRLVQWGRPEDWREVSRRYDIHFNPSMGVPR